MDENILDQGATSGKLRKLAKKGLLDAKALERAYGLAGIHPNSRGWINFIDRAFLILGAALMVSGVFFFFAFNWQAMGRFMKFGIIEALLLAAVFFTHWRGLDSLTGKIGLMTAGLMTGALLAVQGQTYQTGADAYQLFLAWGILILGWAAIGRFTPLWLLVYALFNLSIYFYFEGGMNVEMMVLFTAMFGFNALAFAAWEIANRIGCSWLKSRGTPRLIALIVFLTLLFPTFVAIFDSPRQLDSIWDTLLMISPFTFLAVAAFVFYFYDKKIQDLFILATAAFSLVGVITLFTIEKLYWDANYEEGMLFFFGMLLIGLTALAVTWLRKVSASWEENHETK